MSTYQHFARHYHNSVYTFFTKRVISEIFPHWLSLLNLQPATLLDLACGSGEFAIAQARQGLKVVGLDRSKPLLKLAESEARAERLSLRWVEADMSSFSLPERFDCVTCWFDSLNYLVKIEDLASTFRNVWAHLNPGGIFLFDMNTIYGLLVQWQKQRVTIAQESPDYIEICENSADYENAIAQMRILMFERQGKTWQRHEELHTERGYAVEDLLILLQSSGFSSRYLFGNPLQERPLETEDSRLWIAAQKVEENA